MFSMIQASSVIYFPRILSMTPKIRKQKANNVLAAFFCFFSGVLTGILWAYANPLQLVPGIIQWRTFAFLPPAIGILVSPTAGFISGYIGALVWSLLASTFLPVHTLLVDGVMSGVTGLIPALTTGRKFTLAEMTSNPHAMTHAAIVAASSTALMVVGDSLSFAIMQIYSFWWAFFWFGLSVLVPVSLGTPLAVRYGSRMVQAASWVPTRRL
jgi:hypothetical protein